MSDIDGVRAAARSWLREHWDPDLTMRQWWQLLADAGYSAPHWPKEWCGLGLALKEAAAVRDVFTAEQVPGGPAGLGIMLAGPTILAHGSDEQKARYLPGIASGQVNWCQLFSEPDAGSDLAGLRTAARRAEGGEWTVTGQKVWTSGAQVSDMGMLIARTDPEAPKHKGITWFACEMGQPGIEVRPLREMTGRSLFNEVFLDQATVTDDAIIGDLNDGWNVARTTLAVERASLSAGVGAVGLHAGEKGGYLDVRAGDIADRMGQPKGTSGTALAMRGKNFSVLRELAEERGRISDPAVRNALVDLYFQEQIGRYSQQRVQAARAQGKTPGPESSTSKLMGNITTRKSRDLALQILGADAMLAGSDAPRDGLFQEMALFTPAMSIYGGSDEIQRNVIAERVLGLPRDVEGGSR